jgi:hypothetical protein
LQFTWRRTSSERSQSLLCDETPGPIPRTLPGCHEDIKFPPISNPGAGHIRASKLLYVPFALNSFTLVLMASSDDSKTRRVKAVTECIREEGFSLNEFLVEFYSSKDPFLSHQRGCSLAQSPGCQFAPRQLIDLWFEHCPQSGQRPLENTIIDWAGQIIIKETDRACKSKSLCVATTKLEADDLDRDFLLAKLERVYNELLPWLWLLLFTVVTSWNRSERQKGELAACRERKATHVEFQCRLRSPLPAELVFCNRPAS